MKKLLRQEGGNVVVTAILMLSVMTGLGLAVASQVDTQTAQSRVERERESAFNLAEAALSAQTFILGRRGTGTALIPYPTAGCATDSAANAFCPDDERLMRSYDGASQVDFDASTYWVTHVLDDATKAGVPVRFWKDEYLDIPDWPRYDQYGGIDPNTGQPVRNRHVWVRAEARVRDRTRAIVAWVRVEDRPIVFPQYAVLAGYVDGKNSGGHNGRPLVNSTGSLGIAVRCTETQPPPSACVDLDPTKGPQLLPPENIDYDYASPAAIETSDLQALEDVARANNTYYEGCPENPNGDVVYIKNAGDCKYENSAPVATGQTICCNSPDDPGLLIVERGTLELAGNIQFYGVIYHPNLDNSSDARLVETSGTSALHGGVLVDGPGGVYAGSSGDNIVFDPNAFLDISAVGTAGVVQNTWREIVPPEGS